MISDREFGHDKVVALGGDPYGKKYGDYVVKGKPLVARKQHPKTLIGMMGRKGW